MDKYEIRQKSLGLAIAYARYKSEVNDNRVYAETERIIDIAAEFEKYIICGN